MALANHDTTIRIDSCHCLKSCQGLLLIRQRDVPTVHSCHKALAGGASSVCLHRSSQMSEMSLPNILVFMKSYITAS